MKDLSLYSYYLSLYSYSSFILCSEGRATFRLALPSNRRAGGFCYFADGAVGPALKRRSNELSVVSTRVVSLAKTVR